MHFLSDNQEVLSKNKLSCSYKKNRCIVLMPTFESVSKSLYGGKPNEKQGPKAHQEDKEQERSKERNARESDLQQNTNLPQNTVLPQNIVLWQNGFGR